MSKHDESYGESAAQGAQGWEGFPAQPSPAGGIQGLRHGSPEFYKLLDRMAQVHDMKSHDYATNENPYGNYKFAGMLSKLFDNPDDSGFIGRLGEKLFRLANLENGGKKPKNESIEDTETDICVIVALWVSMRRDRRKEPNL